MNDADDGDRISALYAYLIETRNAVRETRHVIREVYAFVERSEEPIEGSPRLPDATP